MADYTSDTEQLRRALLKRGFKDDSPDTSPESPLPPGITQEDVDAAMRADARALAGGAAQQNRTAAGQAVTEAIAQGNVVPTDPILQRQAARVAEMGGPPVSGAAPAGAAPAGGGSRGAVFAKPVPQAPVGMFGGTTGASAFVPRIAPRAMAEYENAFKQEGAANAKDLATAQKNAGDEEAMYKNQALTRQAEVVKDEFLENQRQRKLDMAQADLQSGLEDLRRQATDIGPEHFWHSKNTGQKALLMIGAVLANAGATLVHQQPVALQQINAAVDQDIEAQKAKWQANKGALSSQESAFGQMMNRFNDERQARAAAKQGMLESLADETRAMAARTGSATAVAKADKVAADLTMQHADFLAKAFGRAGGGAGTSLKSPIAQDLLVPLPGGGYGAAATAKDAEELRELNGANQEVQRILNQALAIRNEHPWAWRIPGTDAHDTINQLQSRITSADKASADKAIMAEAARHLTSWSPGTEAAIRSTKELMQNRTDIAMQAAGLAGTRSGFVRDPRTGALMPYSEYTGTREELPNANAPRGYSVTPAGVPPK